MSRIAPAAARASSAASPPPAFALRARPELRLPLATQSITLFLSDEHATTRLGADIAMALRSGDLLALEGGLGAGKTTLARGLIRQLAGQPEFEVPSPTYTLCQTYALEPPVAHYDLYRLGEPAELDELGLGEALAAGAALVEWPEHGGDRLRGAAATATVALADEAGGRRAVLSGDGALLDRIARSLAIRAFLDRHWGPGAARRFLLGDASARRYETATLGGETRIVMDSPRRPDGPPVASPSGTMKPYSRIAHLAEDVVPFIAVDRALVDEGFAAPAIHAASVAQGLLLCEHLGTDTLLDAAGVPVAQRYVEAGRLLARLHARDWPHLLSGSDSEGAAWSHEIPAFDREALMMEASLLADWYAPAFAPGRIGRGERDAFLAIWGDLADILAASPPTLVLRDYHSPNIIWRGDRPFPVNIGLIDFQDALIGPAAYDLASLAQDARVDIAPSLEDAIVAAYMEERSADSGFDRAGVARDYAILAAQRATKILGIFVRLDRRDGKPAYLRHLPRLRAYLGRSLAHPALEPYRRWCDSVGLQL